MPDRALALLSAYLWDLRAQCEAQVRALTDAQRQLDVVRDTDDATTQRAAAEQLNADLRRVTEANVQIREGVGEAAEQAARLATGLPGRPQPH